MQQHTARNQVSFVVKEKDQQERHHPAFWSQRQGVFCGYEGFWGASRDEAVYCAFDLGTLHRKRENRKALEKELGMQGLGKNDLLVLISPQRERLEPRNLSLLRDLCEGIQGQRIHLILDSVLWKELALHQHEQIHTLNPVSHKSLLHRAMAGSDAALCLGLEGNDLGPLRDYGVVPLLPKGSTQLLKEYDPVREKGNAFFYEAGSHWSAYAALIRASEHYRFPADWREVVRG